MELVQGLTGSPEGIAQLAAHGAKLLPPLFRLVPGPEAVSRPALASLVNLSQAGVVGCVLTRAACVWRYMRIFMQRSSHPMSA